MLLGFVHKLFIHHILKYPSSAILWQQDTVQYNTIQYTQVSLKFYSFVTRLEFVLLVYHHWEHHTFHNLWTTPKEANWPAA